MQALNRRREAEARARLLVLDRSRELIREAREFEQRAELARTAAVEALRHAWPPVGWRAVGELLELSGQGAHKRYRHVDDAEPAMTIDDELAQRP